MRLLRPFPELLASGRDFTATLLRPLAGTDCGRLAKVAKVAEVATLETRASTGKVAKVAKVAACARNDMQQDDLLLDIIDAFEAEPSGLPTNPLPPAPPPTTPEPEPATHCACCGSPSWWRSPSSPTWRCAYCEPRPEPFSGTSLTLDSGRWAPGCAPPARPAVTAADVLAAHGPVVAGCVTAEVLAHADPADLAEFLDDAAALVAFARALVADGRVRPLPPASLPPLARIAEEIGEPVADLRAWLDRTAVGRALRVRLEREPGACDRALLGLRADPAGGLLGALDGGDPGEDRAHRHDDGRVQDEFGAWRTPAEHAAHAAYDRHHWTCETCQRAGRGYGARCPEGERLHALTMNPK